MKVLSNYRYMNDGKLLAFAGSVFANMTGNTYFPDPPVGLDALSAAVKTMNDSIVAAETKDKIKLAQKREAKEMLLNILSSNADYVEYTANSGANTENIRSIILSSGYSASAEIKTSTALGSIKNFTVEMGKNSGEVVVSISSVDNAMGYHFYYAIMPMVNDAWVHQPWSESTYTFENLPAGKELAFKAGATGRKNRSVYTGIITRIVS